FWFGEDAGGRQVVVYKNGTTRSEDIEKYDADMTEEAYKGLQRARLYMTEVGEGDGTAFAAAMDATFAYGPFTDNQGEIYAITLSTPMAAEKRIYPLLTDEQIAKSKEYVDEFYGNSQSQIGRDLGILYPVCMKVYVDHKKEPYDVRECEEIFRIQSGEVMDSIDDESIDIMFENLNREYDYAPRLDERGYPIGEATIMPADYGQEAFFIKDAESGEVFRVYKIESGFSSVFEMRRIDYYISRSDLKRSGKSKCFDGDDFIMEYMDGQDRLDDMLDIVTSGGTYTIE
ncbi:MAG: hypothetical protein HUJ78_06100, partial [Mogibacterium sp.]|nr:hypothetical protein [Mogibacterium sp.]